MTDQEFNTLLEAAFYEDANDRDGMTPEFLSDIALRVHRDLLETHGLELQTRGSVTDLEIKQIEAMKQALLAYNLLSAQRHAQTAVRKTQAMDPGNDPPWLTSWPASSCPWLDWIKQLPWRG
jgi:hypothetical protein